MEGEAGDVLGESGKCCEVMTVEVDPRRFVPELTEEGSELVARGEVENVELFCGRAEVSNAAPVECCGGRTVEASSSVVDLMEEKLGVTAEVENVVLVRFAVVVVVVGCGGFSGFTMHSSEESVHSSFPIHLIRLEVPALLTYPSMHL